MKSDHQKVAGVARDFLREQGISLPFNTALELAARMDGFKNLHHAQQEQAKAPTENFPKPELLVAPLVTTLERLLRAIAWSKTEDRMEQCEQIQLIRDTLRNAEISHLTESPLKVLEYIQHVCSQHDEWWIGEFSEQLNRAIAKLKAPGPIATLRVLDLEDLRLKTRVIASSVGPGEITEFAERGTPKVNGIAVSWVRTLDGIWKFQESVVVPQKLGPDEYRALFAATLEECKAYELTGYAATAAFAELKTNWDAAIGEGWPLEKLLKDLEEVKGRLDQHRDLIKKHL